MNLTEGQLFTIEALNRIEWFVWLDDMNYVCMIDGSDCAWFFQNEPTLESGSFDAPFGWVVKTNVGVKHPDWRNSLITREQFDSVDGWVRHDNTECPANIELQVQVKMHGFLGYSPSYPHIAKAWPWVNGGITHWRYHKPTKETEMQNPKPYKKRDCIETLIDKRKDAIEQKRLALATLEEAEAKERELMLSIQAWAESYGFDIRVLDESDEVPESEPDPEPEPELVITDWRDLRVGDVVWWSGDDDSAAGEYTVFKIESYKYDGSLSIAVKVDDDYSWINNECEQWKFIRRPSK